MFESKPHTIIAGIADFYFLSFICGAVLSLISILYQIRIPFGVLVSFYPIAVIGLMFYHNKKYQVSSLLLSPGEKFAGRLILDEKKIWCNPYGKNRFFLYFCLILGLIIMGNSWDCLGKGRIMSFPEWLGISITLLLFSIGLVKAGQKNDTWVIFPIIAFGIHYLLFTNPWIYYKKFPDNYPSVETLVFYGKIIYGSLLLLFIVAFIIYNLLNKIENIELIGDSD